MGYVRSRYLHSSEKHIALVLVILFTGGYCDLDKSSE